MKRRPIPKNSGPDREFLTAVKEIRAQKRTAGWRFFFAYDMGDGWCVGADGSVRPKHDTKTAGRCGHRPLRAVYRWPFRRGGCPHPPETFNAYAIGRTCVGAGFYAVERSGTSALGVPRPKMTIPPSTLRVDTSATLRRTTQCAPQGYLLRGAHWAASQREAEGRACGRGERIPTPVTSVTGSE